MANSDPPMVLVLTTSGATRAVAETLRDHEDVTVTADSRDDPVAALTDASTVACVVCDHDQPAVDATAVAARTAERDLPCLLVSDRAYGNLDGDPLANGVDAFHRAEVDDSQTTLLVRRIEQLVVDNEREQALERERAYRNALLEDPDQSIVVLDEEGRLLEANWRALAFVGLFGADEQITGIPLWEAPWATRSTVDQSAVKDAVEQATSGSPARQELTARDRNYNLIEVEIVYRPVESGDTVVGAVATARDVTQERSRKRRLEVLTRVLRHNVRNDLSGVLGHVSLIEDEATGDIADSAATIHELLDGLTDRTDLAHKVEQSLSFDRDPVPKADVAETLADELERLESVYTVQVDQSIPDSRLARAESGIDIAFRVLLENAVEHNDSDQPRVSVEMETVEAEKTWPDDDGVEIRIADNGPGIPDREVAVLEEGSETTLEHGSGLGLWAAKWVVTDSGGTLSFEENDPRGTVAIVTLAGATDEE